MNKGQVTIFIIIGLVIIIGAGLVMFYQSGKVASNNKEDISKISGIDAFNRYITECISMSLKGAAVDDARQSFTASPDYNLQRSVFMNSEDSSKISVNSSAMRIFAYEDKNEMPSKDEMTSSFKSTFSDKFNDCLEGLSEFSKRGYEYNLSAPKITIDMTGRLSAKIDLTGTVRFEDATYYTDDYAASVDYDYMKIYDTISRYIGQEIKDPKELALGYLTNMAYEEDFRYEAYYVGLKSTVIKVIFTDSENSIGEDIIIPFAVRLA